MKTDTKRGAAKLEKPEGGKILKNMRRLGSYHFHTKVPFDQGPKFKNRKYTLEWQRGWKQAKAYEQGYKAGLTGDKAKKIRTATNQRWKISNYRAGGSMDDRLSPKW